MPKGACPYDGHKISADRGLIRRDCAPHSGDRSLETISQDGQRQYVYGEVGEGRRTGPLAVSRDAARTYTCHPMAFEIIRSVKAPIDRVFAFFDDPANTVETSPHAERFEVIDMKPDGRRTYDVWMPADDRDWMQTIEQVLREPPHRLITRGGSWTADRSECLLTIVTDRQFSADGDGTRVYVTIETRLCRPLRHPLQALRNWLQSGYAQREFEHRFALIAKRIEAQ